MIPGAFTPPPPIREARPPARADPAPANSQGDGGASLRVFAITLAGVAGFVGLLIAGARLPDIATPLRVLALGWFAVFGVWHARASARIPRRSRRSHG